VTPNIHYENREIEGERLELTNKEAIYWLGPNVTLRDCTLVTHISARWLHLVSGSLIDCAIHAKSQLKGLPWTAMKLKGCRFKGRFAGNEFGFREDGDARERAGGIEDCDFSEAQLQGCGFYNCDMSTIRLPRWPCFTFLNPLGHVAELRQNAWPGRVGRVTIEVVCESPTGTVAVTWHAPTVAEKMDTTVEELRAALERVPGVVM
jgi:hypothetical protein